MTNPGIERRKLPDPVTPRLLVLWALLLPAAHWAFRRFFQKELFLLQDGRLEIRPVGAAAVFGASAAGAVLLACAYYKYRFGKFHLLSVLRVVRGVLSLFLVVLVFFWPISMMVVALNPAHGVVFIALNAAVVGLLALAVRLAAAPEKGFWQDWINDTLLRW